MIRPAILDVWALREPPENSQLAHWTLYHRCCLLELADSATPENITSCDVSIMAARCWTSKAHVRAMIREFMLLGVLVKTEGRDAERGYFKMHMDVALKLAATKKRKLTVERAEMGDAA